MIKAIWVIVVAVAAAVVGYNSYYWSATSPAHTMLQKSGGEMEWLRCEFHLSDEQFTNVRKLHEEYAPKCDQMCMRIAEANSRANQLISANNTMTPEVEAALKECTRVQAECRRAMLAHVYAVAGAMSPAEGARYVAMMKERIIEPALPHSAVISDSAK